jgi:poly(A) polymerase
MIRKLLRRVFRRGDSPTSAEPAVIPVARHGVRHQQVSLGARRTCETLQQAGYKAYVVGGAVRDLIAGIVPKDFDIATDATPEQVRGPVPPRPHHRPPLPDRACDAGRRNAGGIHLPRRA